MALGTWVLAFQPGHSQTWVCWACWAGREGPDTAFCCQAHAAAGPGAAFRPPSVQVQKEMRWAHLLPLLALETPPHPQAGRDLPSLPLPTYSRL